MKKIFKYLFVFHLLLLSALADFAPILMNDITLFIPYNNHKVSSHFTINTTNTGNRKVLTIIVSNPADIKSYIWKEGNRILSSSNRLDTSKLSSGLHTITITVIAINGERTTQTITICNRYIYAYSME